MYKTILVLLDGSSEGRDEMAQVETLARRHKARLILLQVIADPAYATLFQGAKLAAASHAHLKELITDCQTYLGELTEKAQAAGVAATLRVEEGPIAETIVGCAEREGADLIVLGAKNIKALPGSIAENVLRTTRVPVLIISKIDGSTRIVRPHLRRAAVSLN